VARRSAFFFYGHLHPAELANFNVQNVFLRDHKSGCAEVMGNGMAVWWPSRPTATVDDLTDAARAWFRTIAASYYLEADIALNAELEGWVEALDVTATEAMMGFVDSRFIKVRPPQENDEINIEMRNAIQLARALRRAGGDIERSTHELLAAANDGTPQCFLSAYRALECIRRIYAPRWNDRARGWRLMEADLPVAFGSDFTLLGRAAQAVRHGDVPARRRARHVVNQARRRQRALLHFARLTVRAAVAKHT
jgi:hypothetical protein